MIVTAIPIKVKGVYRGGGFKEVAREAEKCPSRAASRACSGR